MTTSYAPVYSATLISGLVEATPAARIRNPSAPHQLSLRRLSEREGSWLRPAVSVPRSPAEPGALLCNGSGQHLQMSQRLRICLRRSGKAQARSYEQHDFTNFEWPT